MTTVYAVPSSSPHAPARYLVTDREQLGHMHEWLAYPTPERGWRFEPVPDGMPLAPLASPYIMAIPTDWWLEMLEMLQAFGRQRRGVLLTIGEQPLPPPRVVWEAAGAKADWAARYTADPPTLTINRQWWRKASAWERERTLRALPGDPLGPVDHEWFIKLVSRRAVPTEAAAS